MGHSSVALSLSLGGLFSPVVFSELLIGETASRASLVLNVVTLVAASPAFNVHLSVSFSHRLSSLALDHPFINSERIKIKIAAYNYN